MTKNDIKKALYKQKPSAEFRFIRIGVAYYKAYLDDGKRIEFQVPIEDMGTADFFPKMEAKHLNRWIVEE